MANDEATIGRLVSPRAVQVRGWNERRSTFWVTADEKILRSVYHLPEVE